MHRISVQHILILSKQEKNKSKVAILKCITKQRMIIPCFVSKSWRMTNKTKHKNWNRTFLTKNIQIASAGLKSSIFISVRKKNIEARTHVQTNKFRLQLESRSQEISIIIYRKLIGFVHWRVVYRVDRR